MTFRNDLPMTHHDKTGMIRANRPCNNQQGNVLFLTLMAFILFVALAYVVMNSFRGGDDSNREITLRSAASVTQYSSAIRTGVTRMLLRDVALSDLDFSAPVSSSSDGNQAFQVFNPAGGGVTYRDVPEDVVNQVQKDASAYTAKRNGNWYFTMISIAQIGTSKNELVALLHDVKDQFCQDINYQIIGTATVPALNVSSDDILQGRVRLTGALIDGQPFLCVRSNDANIYYHVLAEQ